MKPIPFNPDTDRAPIPFHSDILKLALDLKRAGLEWHPHPGCFVWDPDRHINVPSPFPENVYFILSVPRFIDIFGSIDAVRDELVWLPTWHQARLVCGALGVEDDMPLLPAGQDLAALYQRILRTL